MCVGESARAFFRLELLFLVINRVWADGEHLWHLFFLLLKNSLEVSPLLLMCMHGIILFIEAITMPIGIIVPRVSFLKIPSKAKELCLMASLFDLNERRVRVESCFLPCI